MGEMLEGLKGLADLMDMRPWERRVFCAVLLFLTLVVGPCGLFFYRSAKFFNSILRELLKSHRQREEESDGGWAVGREMLPDDPGSGYNGVYRGIRIEPLNDDPAVLQKQIDQLRTRMTTLIEQEWTLLNAGPDVVAALSEIRSELDCLRIEVNTLEERLAEAKLIRTFKN